MSCLKQKSATYTPPNRTNFFIVYELGTWSQDLNSNFTLRDCLFRGVKLASNAHPDKYLYRGYGIGFNSHSELSLPDGSVDKNFIIFGVNMSSSTHSDNKKKDILILGLGSTQKRDDATLPKERVEQRVATNIFKYWKGTSPFYVNELFVPSRNT